MSTINPLGAGASTLQYQPVSQLEGANLPVNKAAPTEEQTQASTKTLESKQAVVVDISETAQAQMQSTVRPVEAGQQSTLNSDSSKPVPQTEFDVGLLALDQSNDVPKSVLSVLQSAGDPILQFNE